MLIDLDRAMHNADLNDLEKAVIASTYLSTPTTPIRNGRPGRPRGAGQIGTIAMSLSEQLKTGLERKRTSTQTEYHSLHRSIKQYNKVLNRALVKIDKSLDYGGIVELPSATLRHLSE